MPKSEQLPGQDDDILPELRQIFFKTFSEELAQIRNAYRESDSDKLIYLVHKMHGSLIYCNFPNATKVTREFETALRKDGLKDKHKIAELYQQVIDALTQLEINQTSGVDL